MKTTNHGSYHGGWIQDEFAALLSLCFGARLKAGGIIRMGDGTDLRGRPQADTDRPVIISRTNGRSGILPNFNSDRTLTSDLFETYFSLSGSDAIGLVRAARLYQESVWISESAPQLSWIMLVSAVEVIAGRWAQATIEAQELLKDSKPALSRALHDNYGEDAVRLVASHLRRELRAQYKFREFILNFLPEPPAKRPRSWLQIDWEKDSMGKVLSKVYDCRSQALHGGVPFPPAMCVAPFQRSEDEAHSEKPHGLAMAGQGGAWTQDDQPLLLHIFEYIVRSVILNWWKSVIPERLLIQE